MATSKTLTPTNVTIQIPAFADKPDQRVNSNCIDKEADAINALSDQIATAVSNTNQNDNWCTLSSAESGAVKNCRKIGKTIYIDFIGNSRTHTESETILTLNSGFRPVASCKLTGSINGTAVVLNADASTGDVTIYLLNGATGAGRLYCNCAMAIE